MPRSFAPGQWALITGASSGFGRDFATLLAEQRINLVLTARRREPMEADAERLMEQYGIQVEVLPADLSRSEAREDLLRSIAALDIHIDILINNAGVGVFGPYEDTEWSRLDQMLQLDVVGLSHLSSLVLPAMRARSEGYILQVASIGGYQATPGYAAYSAAKAYVLLMGEALNRELRGTGVRVTVLSPGVSATQFLEVSGQKPTLYQKLFMMKSRPVARLGLQALLRGKMSVVPGIFNNLMVQSLRLMPRVLQANVAGLLMRNR